MKQVGFCESKRGNGILPALMIVLLVAVGVQSYFLYRLYQRVETKKPETASAQPQETAKVEQQAAPQTGAFGRIKRAASPDDEEDVFDFPQFDWDRWDPFKELNRIQQEMERLFRSSMNRFRTFAPEMDFELRFAPEMDLTEDGTNYVVRFDLPGVDKSKISVRLEDRLLTVEGSTDESIEEKSGARTIRRERRMGRFSRTITLPGPVQSEGMKANYENGVLTVIVPKAPAKAVGKVITL